MLIKIDPLTLLNYDPQRLLEIGLKLLLKIDLQIFSEIDQQTLLKSWPMKNSQKFPRSSQNLPRSNT